MNLRYRSKDPDRAYISNNLLLPKEQVVVKSVKNSLEFVIGEESYRNEFGEVVGTSPKWLRLWDETEHHLIVPRNFISPDNYSDFPFEFVDDGPSRPPKHIPFVSRAHPRDDIQREALDSMTHYADGTLNLACGRGKTVVSLMAIATMQVPALIVVNSKNLIAQWSEQIKMHLRVSGAPPEIGVIQGKTCTWKDKPITIATIQTLASRRDSWPMAFRQYFGVVVFDEGHHMSAPHFVKAADLFYGRRFALTATARRTDGLEAIYQYHLGGVMYRNLDQDLIPRTVFHKIRWKMPAEDLPKVTDVNGEFHHSKIRTYLGGLEWRNELIASDIDEAAKEGKDILVLSHSINGTKGLASFFGENNYIIGDIKDPEARHIILHSSNPVFGIFQLASEALDKPSLNSLFITTVFSNSNDLQQAWGRTQRGLEGKQNPEIHVYEDVVEPIEIGGKRKHPLGFCVGACRALRKYLKVLRYPFSSKIINMLPGQEER